jgi:hypothetical protein
MQVIYAGEKAPEKFIKSIFLVGPTPRSQHIKSWRPKMLEALSETGYDGVAFVPEARDGWPNCEDQIDWEQYNLNMSDLILAWVPRGVEFLGLTTNIEIGMYIDSGKIIYGRPDWASNCNYLDYTYEKKTGRKHCKEMKELAE